MDRQALVVVQKTLDGAFRDALRLCEGLPQALHEVYKGQPATAEIDIALTRAHLQPVLNSLYQVVLETMFRVAPTLGEEESAGPLNLYLWPAYHSLITRERIDYVPNQTVMGLGMCGQPEDPSTWQSYSDSAQAMWHETLFREVRVSTDRSRLAPPSIDAWLVAQMPHVAADDPYDVLHSLTLTLGARSDTSDDAQNLTVRLLDDSRTWGFQLADRLNGLHPNTQWPRWQFPDRRDVTGLDEPEWREVRCLLYSVWLHSAFRSDNPSWLQDVLSLFERRGLGGLVAAIERKRVDDGAGNTATPRPAFANATVICLHRLLAHDVLTGAPSTETNEERTSRFDDRALGTACVMSSCHLGPAFVEVIRPWLRSVFAMIRNSELTVFADKLVQTQSARARLHATGFIIHELNVIFAKQFSNVRERVGDCDESSINSRRFAWDLIGALVQLAWRRGKIAVLDSPERREEIRRDFLEPLRSLWAAGLLERALTCVGSQVYNQSHTKNDQVRIPALEELRWVTLTPQQYARCFLMVAESIRNCVEHGLRGTTADWHAHVDGSTVTIVLRQVWKEDTPNSPTFVVFGLFLREVGIGDAPEPAWVPGAKGSMIEWVVKADLRGPITE